jgi:signal transduction histidine kinase
MPAAALPTNEPDRLRELHRYQVLDTPPDAGLDALTQLAARIAETPMAAISLTDETRQWFKSRVGLNVPEIPRDWAPCAHAVETGESIVCADMRLDPRFADNPLVTGPPHLRFYAGMALRAPRGTVLGTLAVLDTVPRVLSESQRETLELIAKQIVDQLELRASYRELAALREQEQAFETRLLREKAEEARELAAELHDGVGQDLTGISMLLGAMLRDARERDSTLTPRLAEMSRLLQATIDSCRSAAQKQGGFLIRKEGLGGAIVELGQRLERTGDPRFVVERCEPPIACLDELTAYHFFRIVGEAMTNACRHSGAREVHVRLSHGGGTICCAIEDDGVYKSRRSGASDGVGESIMAYRARAIGAELERSERPGGGLRVECRLPCGCRVHAQGTD